MLSPGLVGMQSSQQAIQGHEAGTATKDAIEPGAQRKTAAGCGLRLIELEVVVKVPNQRAHTLLSGAMQIREGIKLVHQPFRMHPAQRVPAHRELPGIVAQHDSIAQETMGMNAAQIAPSVATCTGSGIVVRAVKPSVSRCACQAA